MALIKVGGEPITSFTDGTRSAQVVSNLYDQTKQSLFYSTFWNFATEKTQLARLVETPTDKSYKFAYQAPGDVMRIKGVFDESGVLDNTYSYEQNKIYTNLNTCNLIYIKEVSEALVSKLAYEICEGVTGVATKSQRLAQEYEKKLRFAKVTDAQETPPQSIVGAGHLVEARISGSTPSVIKERFN
jgi:hypothetical protein